MYDLSIIITTFNSGKTIGRLLESIRALNFGTLTYEIIVVDNHSSKDSLSETKLLLEGFKNQTILVLDSNTHCGGARNRGVDISQGRYITFADDDDEFAPGLPPALHLALTLNPDILLCVTEQERKDRSWELRALSNVPLGINISGAELLEKYMETPYWHPAWGCLYRSQYLREVNRPFVECRASQDNDWKAWHIYKSQKVAYCEEHIYRYTYNVKGVTKKQIGVERIADNAHCAARRIELAKVIKTDCPRFAKLLWGREGSEDVPSAYLGHICPKVWASLSVHNRRYFYIRLGDDALAVLKNNYDKTDFVWLVLFHPHLSSILTTLLLKPFYCYCFPLKKKLGRIKRILFHG